MLIVKNTLLVVFWQAFFFFNWLSLLFLNITSNRCALFIYCTQIFILKWASTHSDHWHYCFFCKQEICWDTATKLWYVEVGCEAHKMLTLWPCFWFKRTHCFFLTKWWNLMSAFLLKELEHPSGCLFPGLGRISRQRFIFFYFVLSSWLDRSDIRAVGD